MTKFTLDEFQELELEYDLYSFEHRGINPWELVRFEVVKLLQRELTDRSHAHDRPDGARAYLQAMNIFGRNIINRNPITSSSHKYLFFGHPRRKLLSDGLWWDPYCDPIHQGTDLDYIHFEYSDFLTHSTPAKTDQLRYIDVIDLPSVLAGRIGRRLSGLPNKIGDQLEEFEAGIRNKYDIDIDVLGLVREKLWERLVALPLYKRIIQRVDPSLVVIVVNYGRGMKNVIEACHDLGIPVVELQHGIIHPEHSGYNFPNDVSVDLFPDYILTFGEFWNTQAAYPIETDKRIAAGYPYLERQIETIGIEEKTDDIIFLSQGTIGIELSQFAVETENDPAIERNIIYKLHPGEYDRWRNEYPWLIDTEIEVIDSSDPPLYELFARSAAQVGVSSTAVYEGLAFDLETYVYNYSESHILQPLLNHGVATPINTSKELSRSLGKRQSQSNHEHYFRSDSVQRIKRIISALSSGQRPDFTQ